MQRRRIDGGKPLREAMQQQGISMQQLAAGTGVSYQLVAFLATERSYARETTSDRTATLIEEALGQPRGSLFE